MRRRIILALCCSLFLAAGASAEDESHYYTTNDKGETVWALTDYLHGTTAQVRALLNTDVDRLTALVAETRQNISELTSDSALEKRHGLDQVKASAKYRELTDEMNQADAQRKSSEGQDKLDASSRFNKARFALQKLEDDAAALDTTFVDDQKNLAAAKKNLVGHEAALQKAKEWRGHLVAAIRSTFELEAPLRVGKKGLVSNIMITATSDDTVIGQYGAAVTDSAVDAGAAEGIQTKLVDVQMVNLMVSGSFAAKVGKSLPLNRTFEVTRRIRDPQLGVVVYAVKQVDSEVDKLLDGMPVDEAPPPTTRPTRPPGDGRAAKSGNLR